MNRDIDEAAAETPLSDHVNRALERMASGQWRLILEHPNPAEGTAVYTIAVGKEIARRACLEATTPGKAVTAAQLADALGCFWNAAIGAAHNSQDSTTFATIGAISDGLAAVQRRLEEVATSPHPALEAEAGRPTPADYAWQRLFDRFGRHDDGCEHARHAEPCSCGMRQSYRRLLEEAALLSGPSELPAAG